MVFRAFGQTILINTPLQRGALACGEIVNRFSGFTRHFETAEAVHYLWALGITPLKGGVNESAAWTISMCQVPVHRVGL